MIRQLLILRHAKSDWQSKAKTDFDRPLASRGRRDAIRIGQYLAKHRLIPDYIIASPAKRAQKTARMVCNEMEIPAGQIQFDEAIYLASLETLLTILAKVPRSATRVMLTGHNPGLDELLLYLANKKPLRSENGKLMTTAACAVLDMPDDWRKPDPHTAELLQLIRPKEL